MKLKLCKGKKIRSDKTSRLLPFCACRQSFLVQSFAQERHFAILHEIGNH